MSQELKAELMAAPLRSWRGISNFWHLDGDARIYARAFSIF